MEKTTDIMSKQLFKIHNHLDEQEGSKEESDQLLSLSQIITFDDHYLNDKVFDTIIKGQTEKFKYVHLKIKDLDDSESKLL